MCVIRSRSNFQYAVGIIIRLDTKVIITVNRAIHYWNPDTSLADNYWQPDRRNKYFVNIFTKCQSHMTATSLHCPAFTRSVVPMAKLAPIKSKKMSMLSLNHSEMGQLFPVHTIGQYCWYLGPIYKILITNSRGVYKCCLWQFSREALIECRVLVASISPDSVMYIWSRISLESYTNTTVLVGDRNGSLDVVCYSRRWCIAMCIKQTRNVWNVSVLGPPKLWRYRKNKNGDSEKI